MGNVDRRIINNRLWLRFIKKLPEEQKLLGRRSQFKQYPAARFRNCRIKIAWGQSGLASVEAAYVCGRFPALRGAGNLSGCHTIIPRRIIFLENSTTLATSSRFSCVCLFRLLRNLCRKYRNNSASSQGTRKDERFLASGYQFSR